MDEEYTNHWLDYGGIVGRFACKMTNEHCRKCGRELVQ